MQNLLRALKIRPFAYLWSGQLLSRLGDFLYQIALAWWVLEVSGSATAMATVLIFAFAPTVIFMLIGGVAADRYPRLPILITSDILRGIIVLLVAGLAWGGWLQIWHVYILSLSFGIVDAFFQPAYAALIPQLVTEDDLPSANALSSLTLQLGRIAGPPLGAAVIAFVGIELAFALNGITFSLSALLLLPIGHVAQPTQPTQQSFTHAFSTSIKTVAAERWLWMTICVFALTNIALAGPYGVALPFLVSDHLGADVGTLGLLYALFAVGYVLGGVWIGRKQHVTHHRHLVFGGTAIASLALALFGLPIGLIGLAIAALVNGAALEIGTLAWTQLLQARVPVDKLGRVTSVDMVGSYALLPIGYALAGWATDLLGAPLIFVISGGVMTLIAVLAWRHPFSQTLTVERTFQSVYNERVGKPVQPSI